MFKKERPSMKFIQSIAGILNVCSAVSGAFQSIKNKNALAIMGWMLLACLIMQYVELIIMPIYWVKAFIKIMLFLMVPASFIALAPGLKVKHLVTPVKPKDMVLALVLGIGCVLCLLLGYWAVRPFLDQQKIVKLLGKGPGVSILNFAPIAVYIALVNSFVEEFFFRGIGYLLLRRYLSGFLSSIFSGLCFALYHIGIINGWFNLILFLLAVGGLMLVGMFFNHLDTDCSSIFPSWIVHMLSNVAINLIGLIMFMTI